MPNPRVFFNIEADGSPLGRVVFELFRDEVPKTVENFRALATGEKGLSPVSQTPLYYKGCIIHRSIENFMIQGGDFTKRNGTGGESIYGHPFEDENFNREVDAEGLLVMANRGPNTNSSQFFITVRPCPHLNGKHVVFGRVVSGLDIVKQISELPVDDKARPLKPVVIASCGELELRKKREPTPESVASSESEVEHRRKSRRRSRSASPDAARSRHKKHKSKRKDKERKRDKEDKGDKDKEGEPRKETEEEYDARLEREENERIAARRKAEMEERKRRLEKERERAAEDGGIRYKGRGQMKYRDPDR